MAQNKVVEDFLAQDLDRKQFLARVGVLGLSLVGIGAFLRFFSSGEGLAGGVSKHDSVASSGYSSGAYGGKREQAWLSMQVRLVKRSPSG